MTDHFIRQAPLGTPIQIIGALPTAPYRPGGLPLYWMDEQSGKLARAVRAWLSYQCKERTAPDPEQMQLLIEYCRHWINAPCWVPVHPEVAAELQPELDKLREQSTTIQTPLQLADWLHACLSYGLDPF